MRAGATLAGIAFFVLAAVRAEASPSARLVYVRGSGAEACPAEADLRTAVAVRLGYDPFFPTAQKSVVAQISRVPKGYRARVQIVGDDGNLRGERELSTKGDDCKELTSAIALAISLALDDLDEPAPYAPSNPPARTPEPSGPEPTPAPERPAPVRDAPPVTRSARRRPEPSGAATWVGSSPRRASPLRDGTG